MKWDNRIEGALAVVAALFVLFSSMLDPRISVILAGAAFMGLAIFKFAQKP